MQNIVYTITGNKGHGKSYTAAKIIEKYYYNNLKDYIVIIDNDPSYQTDKGLTWLDRMVIDRSIPDRKIDYEKMIRVHRFVLFEFRDLLQEERKKVINEILNAVYNIENVLLVTDEAHLFFSKYSPAEEYERIITGGRSQRIDQIYVVQRVQMVNLLCLSLSDVMISFKEQEVNAQRRLAEYYPNIKPEDFGGLQAREFFIKTADGRVQKMNTNTL